MEIGPLHIAAAAGAVIGFAFFWLLWRRRRAALSRFEPESRCIVRITDSEVACERPDGKTERVAWSDLERIEVLTTSDGPMAPDVFLLLHGIDGGCAIPQGATGDKELLARLQTLPGFDNERFIEAMGCTSDRRFLCWQKAA